jgi:hypothetical protein
LLFIGSLLFSEFARNAIFRSAVAKDGVSDNFYVTGWLALLIMVVLRHDISKSYWPRCADILAEQNVKLTDKIGCFWRPRLTM